MAVWRIACGTTHELKKSDARNAKLLDERINKDIFMIDNGTGLCAVDPEHVAFLGLPHKTWRKDGLHDSAQYIRRGEPI
ncbi:MAG: hypothetical protein ACI8W7_002201 [Gammaproteobacteria bacterium]|jgi:hypothetical protein